MKQRRKSAPPQATRPDPGKPPAPPQPNQAADNATQRWQRSVRFNWDNGGRRGGSNDGRR